MVNHWPPIFFLVLCAASLRGQSPVQEMYVTEGLRTHAGLRAREIRTRQAEAAVRQADRGYRPDVSFGATYTLASGGRAIDLPIGDLLNPVYTTLNDLTGTQQFPQLDNVSEQFLPNNFYDARVRITQPILVRDLRLNREVKSLQADLARTELAIGERDLARAIRLAYLQAMQARDGLGILEEAHRLAVEQLRVQKSLYAADKILPGDLARAEAGLAGIEADRTLAAARLDQAVLQLNDLAGRDSDAPLAADSVFQNLPPMIDGSQGIRQEELAALDQRSRLEGAISDREESWRQPSLGLQLDLGSQGFGPTWGPYALAGLNLQVPLWRGGRQSARIEESRLARQATQAEAEDARRHLETGLRAALSGYTASREAYTQYDVRLAADQRLYRETQRRYEEGMANALELEDARTRITLTRLDQSLARHALWQQWADLCRLLPSSPANR